MSRRPGNRPPFLASLTAISSIFTGVLRLAVTLALLVVRTPLSTPATAGLASGCALGFVILTVGACRLPSVSSTMKSNATTDAVPVSKRDSSTSVPST